MAKKYREELRQEVQIALEDRDGKIWSNDDIYAAIDRALGDINAVSPYTRMETLSFAGDTRELDLSSLDYDLIEVEGVFYPCEEDDDPDSSFRNWTTKESDVIEVSLSEDPSAGDEADVYYASPHAVTESASTLRPQHEEVVIPLAAAYCLMQKPLYYISDVLAQTLWTNTDAALTAIGTAMTLAESGLAEGRTKIGEMKTLAEATIDDVTARIDQAVLDMATERGGIGFHQGEALSAIDDMTAKLAEAEKELQAGAGLVEEKLEDVDKQIASAITQAAAAVTAAGNLSTYANTVNVGDPLTGYSRQAEALAQASMAYLSTSRAYLNEHSPAGQYGQFASLRIQEGMTKLQQARGYLSLDQANQEYQALAGRELQAAGTLLGQARTYLAEEGIVDSWVKYAHGVIADSNTRLAQARGYMEKISMQVKLTNLSDKYYPIGKDKMALVQPKLEVLGVKYAHAILKRGNFRDWPED